MTKRMSIMLLCVVLLIAALALGKYLQVKKLIASIPKPGPQTVTAMKAEMQDWQPQMHAIGTLVPVRGVDVTTEIAGMVRSVGFASGQDVKAGEVLVQLNADSDVAQLHALQASADLALTVLGRDREQLRVRTISQAQFDTDEADLRSKRASVEQQQATIAKKTIRAPFAGRLGITTVQPGQYLNPGDKVVTLQTIDPIRVDFTLPQQRLSSLSIGQRVILQSDAYAGQSFEGSITAIDPKIDQNTRSVLVEATLANAQARLLPGMFVDVNVDDGGTQRHLTVPQTAITYNPYGSTVFVLVPGDQKDAQGQAQLVARQQFVTTGPTRGDQVAILKGLDDGQQVVTSGQLKLKNGTPVVIDNSVQPANDPNPKPQEK